MRGLLQQENVPINKMSVTQTFLHFVTFWLCSDIPGTSLRDGGNILAASAYKVM